MSQVDQFESVFRSAVKAVFKYRPRPIQRVLLVTDLGQKDLPGFSNQIKLFIKPLATAEWFVLGADEVRDTPTLLAEIESQAPDLICTYRNLHSQAWQYPHSLGELLDVMLQITAVPVLILPHPNAGYRAKHALQDRNQVMVVTNFQSVDDDLISLAASFCDPSGRLYLAHVEDQDIFERYMEAISKIEVIDTDMARQRLSQQLLKEPEDYFASCAKILKQHHPQLDVRSLVCMGRPVEEYRHQIQARKLDLLVLSAKDERQRAMRSVAYSLAVELRQIPLLML